MSKQDISHEEVWDDSALLTSWNEALAEYKKYHSLAVQGKKVPREALDQIQGETAQKYSGEGNQASPNEAEEGEVEAGTDSMMVEDGAPVNDANAPVAETTATSSATAGVQTWPATNGSVGVPQALMNSVQDEGLKNLMMSWYYAGYYTGLYEGQQKAYASMQQQ